MSALKEAIDAQYATYEQHFLANDMDSLKNLYMENCSIMLPEMDAISGKYVLTRLFAGLITVGAKSVSLVADEVGPVVGKYDMFFSYGHYAFSKADGSPAAAGKHVVIWKKIDEGYKLATETFSDNTIWTENIFWSEVYKCMRLPI